MASFLPVVDDSGYKELPSGDNLDCGGWTLPAAPGAENQVLTVDSNGDAVWSSVLDDLTSLTVDNITIDAATITSDTGTIYFADDDIRTTGWISGFGPTGGKMLAGRDDSVVVNQDLIGQYVFYTNDSDGGGNSGEVGYYCAGNWEDGDRQGKMVFKTQVSTGLPGLLVERMSIDNDGSVIIVEDLTVGSIIVEDLTAVNIIVEDLTVDNIMIDGATITSDTGGISFGDETLTTTGWIQAFGPSGGTLLAGRNDGEILPSDLVGQLVFYTNDTPGGGVSGEVGYYCTGTWENGDRQGKMVFKTQSTAGLPGFLVERMSIDNDGSIVIAKDLTVGNITIDAAAITSNTGAINFGDDDLVTTGDITSGQISAESADYPVGRFTRTTNSTNVTRVAAQMVAESDGDMAAGFGTGLEFAVSDTGVSNSVIAGVFGHRGSADNVGSLEFYTNNGDTITSKGRFAADGTFTVDSDIVSGSGTVTGTNIPSPTVADKILVSTGEGVAAWTDVPDSDDPCMQPLTSDLTIYVTKEGDDQTGDGSSEYPFVSIGRAIEELHGMYIGPDHTVLVDIGPGHYLEPVLALDHPFGHNVTFQGDSEFATTHYIFAGDIGTTVYSINSTLGYYEFIFTPSEEDFEISVGDYVLISGAYAGTNCESLQGCHRITDIDGDTVTIRVQITKGTAIPNCDIGDIEVGFNAMRTVITGGGIVGIANHGGNWTKLVVVNEYSHTGTAVSISGGSRIRLGPWFGVAGWNKGLYVDDAEVSTAHSFHASALYNGGFAVSAINCAKVVMDYSVIISGSDAFYADNHSSIVIKRCKISNADSECIRAYNCSHISIGGGSYFRHLGVNGLSVAQSGSTITLPYVDVSEYLTTRIYDTTATCEPEAYQENASFGRTIGGPY